jgi:hypothetical protein
MNNEEKVELIMCLCLLTFDYRARGEPLPSWTHDYVYDLIQSLTKEVVNSTGP